MNVMKRAIAAKAKAYSRERTHNAVAQTEVLRDKIDAMSVNMARYELDPSAEKADTTRLAS